MVEESVGNVLRETAAPVSLSNPNASPMDSDFVAPGFVGYDAPCQLWRSLCEKDDVHWPYNRSVGEADSTSSSRKGCRCDGIADTVRKQRWELS